MRFRRARCWIVTGLAAVAASRMIAAGERPPVVAEDPIAAARRDYDAIKATKAVPEQHLPLNLQGSVPSVDANADAPVPLSPIQRARKLEALREQSKAAASRHWLLDAMAVETPTAEKETVDTGSSRLSIDGNLKSPGTAFLSPQSRGSVSDRANSQETARARSARALNRGANPLQHYMADWLTPRDLHLLQSSASAPASATNPMGGALGSLSSPAENLMTVSRSVLFSAEGPARASSMPSTTSNPYLSESALNAFVAPPPVGPRATALAAPAPPPNASPANVSVIPEAPTTSKSNATEAEKLKRPDDDRYFRQLKRF